MHRAQHFLSRVQVAKALGRSPVLLHCLERIGLGPNVIIRNDRPAYPVADLQRWLSDHTVGGAS